MYLIFDIGGTAIKYCYANEIGDVIDKHEFPTVTLTSLELFINKLSSIYFQSKYKLDGIALSCPGTINSKAGIVEICTAYPYLQGITLTKVLSNACNGVKVTIENDAKCAGLAEMYSGNAKDYDDAIIIVLGTGVGGAIIKDKKLHHGANLFAGEISMIIVDYDKKNHHILTLSDIASTTALCRKVCEVLRIKTITGREIFSMVNDNHQQVITVLNDFCFDLAKQLYNLQHIYDPDIICIGGGISRQSILIKKIQESLLEIHGRTKQFILPNVTSCKYYNDANLIGALYNYKMMK